MTLAVEQVDVEQVRELRHDVLRGPAFPWSESVYPADDDPRTLHLAGHADGLLVGCATWFPEPWPTTSTGPEPLEEAGHGPTPPEATWRLRGMAVAPQAQRSGVGSLLMERAFDLMRQRGARLLWCNARISALPFYEAHGFRRHGETFLSVGDIPHVVAYRHLP